MIDNITDRYPDFKPLECWYGENGKLAGTDSLEQMIVDYRQSTFYFFAGKARKYLVITNDTRIDRQAALKFAIAYHFGAFRLLHIDLRTL